VLDADGADLITGIGLEGRLYLGDTPYGGAASTTSGELSFGLVRARTYTLVVKMGELEVFRGEVSAPAVNSINARFLRRRSQGGRRWDTESEPTLIRHTTSARRELHG
jgi:hypothetical protein